MPCMIECFKNDSNVVQNATTTTANAAAAADVNLTNNGKSIAAGDNSYAHLKQKNSNEL